MYLDVPVAEAIIFSGRHHSKSILFRDSMFSGSECSWSWNVPEFVCVEVHNLHAYRRRFSTRKYKIYIIENNRSTRIKVASPAICNL